MLTLTSAEYRDRVLGGWLGKLLGQAAGAPTDGEKRPFDITDYPQALPATDPASCEGLLFARVWLEELAASGPGLGCEDLVRAWLARIPLADYEYGYARANFRRDLLPPLSGVYDNPFRESLGALARAELWGLLCPGDPATAARYAAQDAALDHAGPGVSAAVALAGMVSTAFAESDPVRIVEAALRLVPRDSRAARAVRDVARWHGELANWRRTREMLLRSYASEDVRDSTLAIGMVTLALLDGEGELGHSLLTAARCGWSSACVAAGVGAVLGAAKGAAALPAVWRDTLSAAASRLAATLAEQTYQEGRAVVIAESDGKVHVGDEPAEEESRLVVPEAVELLREMAMGPYVVPLRYGPLRVLVDYEVTPSIGYDRPRRLGVGVANHAGRSVEVRARVGGPEGFVVVAGGEPFTLAEEGTVSFAMSVTAPEENCLIAPSNACTLFLIVEDEPELAVPIPLVGESVWFASGPFGDFAESYPPEQEPILAGAERLGGEGWRRLSVAEPAVNLVAGMEGEQGTYYLATDLRLPEAMSARLRLASNDGTTCWLNGGLVHTQHEHRPADARVSAEEHPISLQTGWNRLVIKLAQCSPRRFLAVTLRDAQGHPLLDAVGTTPR
jgi:ADP-ribosylglycohydrolase